MTQFLRQNHIDHFTARALFLMPITDVVFSFFSFEKNHIMDCSIGDVRKHEVAATAAAYTSSNKREEKKIHISLQFSFTTNWPYFLELVGLCWGMEKSFSLCLMLVILNCVCVTKNFHCCSAWKALTGRSQAKLWCEIFQSTELTLKSLAIKLISRFETFSRNSLRISGEKESNFA